MTATFALSSTERPKTSNPAVESDCSFAPVPDSLPALDTDAIARLRQLECTFNRGARVVARGEVKPLKAEYVLQATDAGWELTVAPTFGEARRGENAYFVAGGADTDADPAAIAFECLRQLLGRYLIEVILTRPDGTEARMTLVFAAPSWTVAKERCFAWARQWNETYRWQLVDVRLLESEMPSTADTEPSAALTDDERIERLETVLDELNAIAPESQTETPAAAERAARSLSAALWLYEVLAERDLETPTLTRAKQGLLRWGEQLELELAIVRRRLWNRHQRDRQ